MDENRGSPRTPVSSPFFRSGGGRSGSSRSRPVPPSKGEGGFTLIEILAALMILAFTVTTALGVFSRGIALERSAELVHDASRLARAVQQRVVEEAWIGDLGEALPPPRRGLALPEFPGMVYDLEAEIDPDRPGEVYVLVSVRWRRQGREVGENFRFLVTRGKPFPVRIREILEGARK